MTSATAATTTELDADDRELLDTAIDDLEAGARTWTALAVGQRATLLRAVRTAVAASAEEWAHTAAASKGLDRNHPLRGEEWLSGPYSALGALDAYIETLSRMAEGRNPLEGLRIDRAPGGRTRVHAFLSLASTRCCSPASAVRSGSNQVSHRARHEPALALPSAHLENPAASASCSARATSHRFPCSTCSTNCSHTTARPC